MIVYEKITRNGVEYDYAYSDDGRYVVRNGKSYISAIDPLNSNRQYTEGDLIPKKEETEEDK